MHPVRCPKTPFKAQWQVMGPRNWVQFQQTQCLDLMVAQICLLDDNKVKSMWGTLCSLCSKLGHRSHQNQCLGRPNEWTGLKNDQIQIVKLMEEKECAFHEPWGNDKLVGLWAGDFILYIYWIWTLHVSHWGSLDTQLLPNHIFLSDLICHPGVQILCQNQLTSISWHLCCRTIHRVSAEGQAC